MGALNALGVTDFPAFLTITVITILLPGPNSLFVLAVAARQGVADGYRAAAGVVAGDGILMLLAVLGVAGLMQQYTTVFLVLRLAGAAYLAYLGLGLLRAAWQGWRAPTIAAQQPAPSPARVARPFWRTLGICLTNPKAILFFMAFFIQFVDPNHPRPLFAFAVLGITLQMISLAYLSVLIVAGSALAQRFHARPALAAAATAAAGCLFVAFAYHLAASGVQAAA